MSQPIRFGTDGVRGPAGTPPITEAGAAQIGAGVARWAGGGRVLVGWDTRESSEALARAAARGLGGGGAEVLLAGVLPTPALACATPAHGASAAIMVTASHNPWMDNGLKVLGPDGGKGWDPAPLERAIAEADAGAPPATEPAWLSDPTGPWRSALRRPDLAGLTVLLDCAHGAASAFAPAILEDLGASVRLIGASPSGRNINEGCGALHPPVDLAGADLAICLDGDGDRLTLVLPERGALDGDDLIWLLDQGGPVVSTVLANGGLEAALGGRLHRTPVGDRFVEAEMRRLGAAVGGEPSGHVLIRGGPPSACGLATALAILEGGWPLAGRLQGWTRWPAATRDVRGQADLESLRSVAEARAAGARVTVRYSGTEALVRVRVEGADPEAWADRIAREIAP